MNTTTLHAQIAELESQIDRTARAADLADHEANRHHPGQDVRAARRYARQIRLRLHPLFRRMNRLRYQIEDLEAARTLSGLLRQVGLGLFSLSLCCSSIACTLPPLDFERVAADGTMTKLSTHGATTLLTKSTVETTVRNGTSTTHTVSEKDEGVAARAWATGVGVKAAAEALKPVASGAGELLESAAQ
jgi:hypothetical protein